MSTNRIVVICFLCLFLCDPTGITSSLTSSATTTWATYTASTSTKNKEHLLKEVDPLSDDSITIRERDVDDDDVCLFEFADDALFEFADDALFELAGTPSPQDAAGKT